MSLHLIGRTIEWAARLRDQVLKRDVLTGVAMRRVKRSSYVPAPFADVRRLETEPVVEMSVAGSVIRLRPTAFDLCTPGHATTIASTCEHIGWSVTNAYLTDLFDRKISGRGDFLSTIRHFRLPVEIASEGQRYQLAWAELRQQLAVVPPIMSMSEFASLSERVILPTLSDEEAADYLWSRR